jgi:hypothetical protein
VFSFTDGEEMSESVSLQPPGWGSFGDPQKAFNMPVHPAAELIPMMPDDELRDLADDIKKNAYVTNPWK